MDSLQAVLHAERTECLREAAERYKVMSFRELLAARADRVAFSYQGYEIKRDGAKVSITSAGGETTSVELGEGAATDDQRQEFGETAFDSVREFLLEHWKEIEDGQMTAADVGGALFGIGASVIMLVFTPFGDGLLKEIIGFPFKAASIEKGRFWGASVDSLVAALRGRDNASIGDVVAGLATMAVTAKYLPGAQAVFEIAGDDGWSVAVDVGNTVGGAAQEGVRAIGEAAADTIHAIRTAFSDASDEVLEFLGF